MKKQLFFTLILNFIFNQSIEISGTIQDINGNRLFDPYLIEKIDEDIFNNLVTSYILRN